MVGTLPTDLTPLVGRRRELAQLRRLVTDAPSLTLVGPGGIGKTRLAIALAHDRLRAFPDGVWFVPLEGIEDERLLVPHVSGVLGIRARRDTVNPAEGLASGLKGKHLLLVLDGCEDLIEETARLIEAVAQSCPTIRIVATSRTPILGVGHMTYQVPPLAVPGTPAAGKELDGSDAIQFFLSGANAASPGFAVTSSNRAEVHRLVRSLDGLPLAIQLATARLRHEDLTAIVRSVLDHEHLDWSSETDSSRALTLRSSLQRSAARCTSAERALWARLSVFRGTFDLEAVEAICCEGTDGSELLDALQGLVERSVVTREGNSQVARFSMLHLTRRYGEELLTDAEAVALRARHMEWYLDLATRAAGEWNSARQDYWLRLMPEEHANLVLALNLASSNIESAPRAAQAVCDLWRYYWWALGWLAEGVYWVETCSRSLADDRTRARLLVLGSLLAHTVGDHETGDEWLAEGRACARLSGDRLALALADHAEGDSAMYQGHLADATAHFRRALATYEAAETSHRVDTLLMLTLACAAQGDMAGAEAAHLETLFVLDPAERFQRSYSLLFVGESLRQVGEIDQARDVTRAALRLNGRLDDPFGMAWNVSILAEIAGDARDHRRAVTLFAAAHRLWQSMSIDGAVLERLQIRDAQMLDRIRSTLGGAEFARCWREGERLDSTQVVELALGEGRPDAHSRGSEESPLTGREAEIAELVAQGLTNRQIAQRLVIAQGTVDGHLQNVRLKLGLSTRTQIAAWVVRGPRATPSTGGGPS